MRPHGDLRRISAEHQRHTGRHAQQVRFGLRKIVLVRIDPMVAVFRWAKLIDQPEPLRIHKFQLRRSPRNGEKQRQQRKNKTFHKIPYLKNSD